MFDLLVICFHRGTTSLAEGLSCVLQWVHWNQQELAGTGCVQDGTAPGLSSQSPSLLPPAAMDTQYTTSYCRQEILVCKLERNGFDG